MPIYGRAILCLEERVTPTLGFLHRVGTIDGKHRVSHVMTINIPSVNGSSYVVEVVTTYCYKAKVSVGSYG